MIADAPVPPGTRASAAMVLTIQDKRVLVYEEDF